MTEEIPFGVWLRKQRRAMDLSRQVLASQISCAEITLRRIEAGTLVASRELAAIILENLGIPKYMLEHWVNYARGESGMPTDWPGPVSRLPTGTVTFLYCDLVGFTPMWKRDPEAALEMVARHDLLLHPFMAEHGGIVFNIRGDNFVAAFIDPLVAVKAAYNAQRLLAAKDWGTLTPIQTRMALHIGQATIHPSGGYVSVSIASLEPIEKFAHAGQILLSQAMADTIQHRLPPQIRLIDLGEHNIPTLGPRPHLFQIDLEG
jgi:class 3 adenylate cyclase